MFQRAVQHIPQSVFFENYYIKLSDGIEVLLYKFAPINKDNNKPIFILPGFMSDIFSILHLIFTFNKNGFPVYILETREKPSSTMTDKTMNITFEQFRVDISEVLQQTDIFYPFAIIGLSYSCALALKFTMENKLPNKAPEKIILFYPVNKPNFGKQIRRLSFFPKRFFLFLFRLVVFFTNKFSYLIKNKMLIKIVHSLYYFSNKGVFVLRKCLQKIYTFNFYEDCSSIKEPVLIISLINEKHHPIEDAFFFANNLQKAFLLKMNDYSFLETSNAAEIISVFLNKDFSNYNEFNNSISKLLPIIE